MHLTWAGHNKNTHYSYFACQYSTKITTTGYKLKSNKWGTPLFLLFKCSKIEKQSIFVHIWGNRNAHIYACIFQHLYFNIYIISILFCHFRHQIREPCTNKHSKTCSKCHIGKKNTKTLQMIVVQSPQNHQFMWVMV